MVPEHAPAVVCAVREAGVIGEEKVITRFVSTATPLAPSAGIVDSTVVHPHFWLTHCPVSQSVS
jgi:hypothetical protein